MASTDPLAAAGLVTREVRTGSRQGETTRIALARRVYPATTEELWGAITDPERIPRWFLPISGDLGPGGRFQLEGHAGGTVERCEQPSSFAITWEYAGDVSWVEVRLTPVAGDPSRTTLELAHEAVVDPEFWARFGPGAVGVGWDLLLHGLGLHLSAGGAALDPAEFQAWTLSPDGIAFVGAAALDWGEAAAADGDDPTDARAAAERTRTFYTVPPEEQSEDQPEDQPEDQDQR